jgi:hypothetical protein
MIRAAKRTQPWYKAQIKTHNGWQDIRPLRVFGHKRDAEDYVWDLGWEKVTHEFLIVECDIMGESL